MWTERHGRVNAPSVCKNRCARFGSLAYKHTRTNIDIVVCVYVCMYGTICYIVYKQQEIQSSLMCTTKHTRCPRTRCSVAAVLLIVNGHIVIIILSHHNRILPFHACMQYWKRLCKSIIPIYANHNDAEEKHTLLSQQQRKHLMHAHFPRNIQQSAYDYLNDMLH